MKQQAMIGLVLLGAAMAAPAWPADRKAAPPALATAPQLAEAIRDGRPAKARIEFVRGTDEVAAASMPQLLELARLLKNDRRMRIELGLGDDDLARRRERAVLRKLAWLGVPKAMPPVSARAAALAADPRQATMSAADGYAGNGTARGPVPRGSRRS